MLLDPNERRRFAAYCHEEFQSYTAVLEQIKKLQGVEPLIQLETALACAYSVVASHLEAEEEESVYGMDVEPMPSDGKPVEKVAEEEWERQIIDKLPKTKDGKVVLWDDHVWSPSGRKWLVCEIGPRGTIKISDEQGSMFWRLAREHYSTSEAAGIQKETSA